MIVLNLCAMQQDLAAKGSKAQTCACCSAKLRTLASGIPADGFAALQQGSALPLIGETGPNSAKAAQSWQEP
jgi:hypothetical protein